jgi:fatty-acyl-CoA synthase
VTGRSKDLIIKGGRNLVPHEIEEAAGNVPGVRAGGVAAFGVPDERLGTERLVVLAETRLRGDAEREQLGQAVTERVSATIGVPPDQVVLVRPGSVPKTSSGKVRRAEARRLFLSETLSERRRLPLAMRARLLRMALARAARRSAAQALALLYAVYVALGILVLALLFWPPVVLIPSRRLAGSLARLGSRFFLRMLGCRLTVEGIENLPPLAAVIAANHSSYLDTAVLLAAIPRDILFIAKHEVRSWWLVGSYVRRSRHITVDRLDALDGVRAAEVTALAIRAGDSVVVFPEGTFTAATGLRPFKLGAFKVAGETGCPVVPVALRGVRRVLRSGQRVPRPGPIHVWIGPPLDPSGDDWRALVDLRDRTLSVIAERCGEPRLDLVTAGWRP